MSSSPPCSLNCRENPALVSAKLADFAHFSRFLLVKSDCGERTTVAVARTRPAFFSAAAIGSPTSSTSFGEDLAIGNRTSYEPILTSFLDLLCPAYVRFARHPPRIVELAYIELFVCSNDP